MKAIRIITTMLFVSLTTSFALADTFTPVATDKFMMLLNSLFGQLGAFGAASSDPMVGMIKIINAISLSLAGLLVGYLILSSVAGTAHDGEVLGKKHSSLWLPIKFCLATALIIPVFNGYASIQILVGKVVVMGVGMADKASSEMMGKQNLSQIASASLTQPEPKNFAYNLFASYACLNALKKYTGETSILFGKPEFGLTKEDGIKTTVYYLGNKNGGGGIEKDACGKIEISKFLVPANEKGSGFTSSAEAMASMQAISQANLAQASKLMTKMDELASKVVETEKAINPQQIEDAIGEYRKGVNEVASKQVLALDKFADLKKNIDQDGFIFLGAYYNKMSKLIDLTNSSIANVPVASGVTNFPAENLKDRWEVIFKAVEQTVDLSGSGVINYGVGNEEGGTNDSWLSIIKRQIKGGFDPTVILKKIFTSSATLAFDEKENMLMKVQRIGGWAMTIASAGFVGVGVASSTIGNAPGIGLFLCSAMLMIVTPLWIFGFTCLYLIPMIPTFIWIGCIVSYLMVVVQSMLGSSLWVVSMLCEGHEIMGQGQNAFKQLITLLLKPLLMVSAFFASVVLLQVFGTLINTTFVDMWNLSQTDSGFLQYLGGMFAMPFVYVIVATTIIKTFFSAIHTIPDEIMQLLGGVGGSLGGHAKEISGAVGGAGAVAGVAIAAKGLTNAVSSKMSNDRLAKQIKDNNNNNGDKDMTSKNSQINTQEAKDEIIGSSKGFDSVKKNVALDKASDMLGGQGSDGANEFLNNMKKLKADRPELGFDKSVNSALNKQINGKFGSGVGRFVGQSGNGYTTPEARQALNLVKNASDKLDLEMGLPEWEVKSKLASAVSSATKQFDSNEESTKNGGSLGVNDFFVKEINNQLPDDLKFPEPIIEEKEKLDNQ